MGKRSENDEKFRGNQEKKNYKSKCLLNGNTPLCGKLK